MPSDTTAQSPAPASERTSFTARTEVPPAQVPKASTNRKFASLRTIAALILREMSTTYGRTPGGYIWAILEPLAAILFMSLGFSLVMRSPSLGSSFLLFYASGYLPFSLYMSISNMTAKAIRFSSGLLKYPAVTWVDALLARFLLNSVTQILVGAILILGILALEDAHAVFSAPPVLEALGLAMLMALGVGTVNCVLIGLFPIWDTVWSIITRPLFLASGVLFIYEDLPVTAQKILWYNPLMHITGLLRTGIFPTYSANYVSPLYVVTIALTLLTLGLILMGLYHRDVLNRR
ncbi:MAG: sugar ABC transporter permease [Halobacteriovoraceae bacterium]|nr:sugar ABC transporter permease [Halobacteriovoraceae bacterium]